MSSTRPRPGTARPYHFARTIRSTLANGMSVVSAPMPRMPLVTLELAFDAGGARDEVARAGGAALTALGLAEGTTRLPGAALAQEFEALGSALVAGAEWDYSLVHATVTPQRLPRLVDLMGEVIRLPAFPERGLARLRGERLAELEQERVEPRGLADQWFARSLYDAGSRYALPLDGDEVSVRAVTGDDIRRFHASRFTASGASVIITGDVTAEAAIAAIERAFGGLPASAAPAVAVNDGTPRGRRTVIVDKKGAPQTELRIGHRGVPRAHPDYFPLVVMNAILGGLFSSRINLNLRERNGFTYGARSAFEWRRGAGPFLVETAVRTEVTDAATREVLVEIERMRSEPVTADELSLAVDYLVGVFPLRFETTADLAGALAFTEVHKLGADYFDRYRERASAVTIADVRRVAEAHLRPEEIVVTAVGDAATIRAPLERLGIGATRVVGADGHGS